jgi:hypothetical protein
MAPEKNKTPPSDDHFLGDLLMRPEPKNTQTFIETRREIFTKKNGLFLLTHDGNLLQIHHFAFVSAVMH